MELSVTLYTVREEKKQWIHDSPAIGAYDIKSLGSQSFGPFGSPEEAMAVVRERQEHYLAIGFSRAGEMKLQDRSSVDILYSIAEQHVPLRAKLAADLLTSLGLEGLLQDGT